MDGIHLTKEISRTDAFPDDGLNGMTQIMTGMEQSTTCISRGCVSKYLRNQFPRQIRLPDGDGDGYSNEGDVFPTDHEQWADSDSDGRGDNTHDVQPFTELHKSKGRCIPDESIAME